MNKVLMGLLNTYAHFKPAHRCAAEVHCSSTELQLLAANGVPRVQEVRVRTLQPSRLLWCASFGRLRRPL